MVVEERSTTVEKTRKVGSGGWTVDVNDGEFESLGICATV